MDFRKKREILSPLFGVCSNLLQFLRFSSLFCFIIVGFLVLVSEVTDIVIRGVCNQT